MAHPFAQHVEGNAAADGVDAVAVPAKRIRTKLLALAANPLARNPNVKKLTGREGYRLRVGNWRALYAVDPGHEVISVMVIKPRGAAYD
jgi:mRNA interferase RelE/StbE